MKNTHCRCVFPSPTEQEIATIPGPHPGTALRVRAELGHDGYVRLEQLAHNPGLGWYVQKSFTIPAEMLTVLIPQLRKVDCLMPRRDHRSGRDSHIMLPVPGTLRLHQPAEALRKDA